VQLPFRRQISLEFSTGVYRLFQLRVSHQLGPLFFPKIYCNAHGEIIELFILKLRGYRCYFYGFRAWLPWI